MSYQKAFLLQHLKGRENCLCSQRERGFQISPTFTAPLLDECRAVRKERTRKSCEIKPPLFSHQKQQHVMMIITRFCSVFFISRFKLSHNGKKCYSVSQELMRRGFKRQKEISYSQLFANNEENWKIIIFFCWKARKSVKTFFSPATTMLRLRNLISKRSRVQFTAKIFNSQLNILNVSSVLKLKVLLITS